MRLECAVPIEPGIDIGIDEIGSENPPVVWTLKPLALSNSHRVFWPPGS